MRADIAGPVRAARLAAASALLACALCGAAGLPTVEPKLLPPEQAFRFSARALDARTIEARFDIADGYYLYRDKFGFEAGPVDVGVGTPALPAGVRKHDAFFGDVETYRGRVVVRVPLEKGMPGQAIVLKAASQGCADAGVCYPPSVQQVSLALPAPGSAPGPIVEPARRKGLFD